MCGRYWLEGDSGWEFVIEQLQRYSGEIRTMGELCPGNTVPVLCRSKAGNTRPFGMTWGFTAPDGGLVINARIETAAQKPMFCESMESRRCLLPMSAYFEWEHTGRQKRKYRIEPSEPGLYGLAGLYRVEESGPRLTVLTAPVTPELAFIHDRMPVILRSEDLEAWLGGDMPQRQLAMTYRDTTAQLRMF